MNIYDTFFKYVESCSEDKKPAWNPAKSSIQAAGLTFKASLLSRAAIASARRFNILSSRHRGLEKSAPEAAACKCAVAGLSHAD